MAAQRQSISPPAVVGTKLGTSLMKDGQMITVDGTEGTVRLES